MESKIAIRGETTGDIGAIAEVTTAAFENLTITNHTEQFIIEALRAAGALTVSLVAAVNPYLNVIKLITPIELKPIGSYLLFVIG